MRAKIIPIDSLKKRKSPPETPSTPRVTSIEITEGSSAPSFWRLVWLVPLLPVFLLIAVCSCLLHRDNR